MGQEQQEGVESNAQEDLTQKTIDTLEIDLNHALTEEHEGEVSDVDYSQLSKEQLVKFLENELSSITTEVKPSSLKKAETAVREIRTVLDQIKAKDREQALQVFIADTGSEDGFEYKYEDSLLEDNTSSYFKNNSNMVSMFPYLNKILAHLINSVKYLRVFNNYYVKKNYKKIN